MAKKKSVSFILKNCSRRGWRRNRSALVIIDAKDSARVQEYHWFLKYDRDDNLLFIYTTVWGGPGGKTRTLKLGRFIYGESDIPRGYDIGYKDGNPANNQKENLILNKTYNRQSVYHR